MVHPGVPAGELKAMTSREKKSNSSKKKFRHTASAATASEIRKSLNISKKDIEEGKRSLDKVLREKQLKNNYTIEGQANYLSKQVEDYINWRSELPGWMFKRCKKHLDSLERTMLEIKKVSDRLFSL